MPGETAQIAERGVATLLDERWEERRRTDIIERLARHDMVGHQAADEAAQALSLSRRQIYVLIRRAVERVIRDLLRSLDRLSARPAETVADRLPGTLP